MDTDFSRYREVIPYSRFSSHRQSRGSSEGRQQDAIDQWAAAHQLTLSPRRCIDRGLSGYDGSNVERGALGRLIQDLRDGLIPTPALLVVERQDRFGRRPTTQALVSVLSDLLGRGCDLLHLGQQRLYSSALIDRDFGALVTLAAEIHAAHSYSSLLSTRCMAAHERARRRIASGDPVRTGWAPAWIDWEPATNTWELNDYAAVIRRLLALLGEGYGMISVARQLNVEGLPSPRGKAWTQGSVGHILNSEALAGGREVKRRTGEVVWGYWPALLSRDELSTLRQQVSDRKTTLPSPAGKVGFIGQGITRCVCGQPYGYRSSSTVRDGQRELTAYVRCRGRVNGTCEQPALRLLKVHQHLLSRLEPRTLRELVNSLQDTGRIEALQGAVERQQQAVAAAIETRDHVKAAVRQAARRAGLLALLADELEDCETRLAAAEQQLARLRHDLQQTMQELQLDDADQALRAFGQAFALGTDTTEQRRAVNAQLLRLGLTITIDAAAQRVGLALGESSPLWGTLTAADGAALWAGESLREVGGFLEELESDPPQPVVLPMDVASGSHDDGAGPP